MSDLPPPLHQRLGGRYVLKRELGRGGSATVYLAHDLRHERLVAVKVLHPGLSHALGAQRFLREIKLTASLQHPHILSIHDSGEVDEQLFYVMPYVEGDTLRQRLGADSRLSVEETVRIGREVAGALAYAHERGVVHRDIKPENILFSGGHAVLADFGIARAINRASEAITQQGMITGTPAYMSPEQARDRDFDGRSDVYSLSCVLYESMAGVPPYVGSTPQDLLQQRIRTAPPLLRAYRHDVPAPIEAVIAKALSIDPDDRYADARAFSAALSAAIGNSGETLTARAVRHPLVRRPTAWAAGLVLVIVGGAASTPEARDRFDLLAHRVDTAQYAVFPFQYVGASMPAMDAEPVASGTYAAMQRWSGLPLADEMSVSDALRRETAALLTVDDVARIARRVRAGRAVWGRVRVSADSVVVRASVYDALTGLRLREVTRVVRPGSPRALNVIDFHALAAELLRPDPAAALSTGADRGTTSFAAWQAFERGARALAAWRVDDAAVALEAAVAADPAYPQANLWLAQLRFLQNGTAKDWATPLLGASQRRVQLDTREQVVAEALGELASGNYAAACGGYAALRTRDSLDALAWVSLALCQARDRAVIPSPASPSGMAFRASGEGIWRAISRGLEIAPGAFVLFPYEQLRRHVLVEHNRLRGGSAGGVTYAGFPYLAGDTIAYAPQPVDLAAGPGIPEGYEAALRVNRARLLALLSVATRRLPESADAYEALANLLETRDEITGTPNGGHSALTALSRARMLATSPDQHIRLAAADVRLHLKLGDFARSAATADSVLAAQRAPTRTQAYWLRGLAAYTGRTGLAARYDRMSGQGEQLGADHLPAAEEALAALVMRTALGICDDSVAVLVRSVDRTLRSYVGPAERARVRDRLLERPMMLAAPCERGRSTLELAASTYPLIRVQQRIARGDLANARLIADSLATARRGMRPGAISLDNVVLEAWASEAMGHPAAAAARLDVVLSALPTLATFVVTEPLLAAAVGRSMAYRADLAQRLGDPSTAALWAGRVLMIWDDADANLAPTVDRMRRLAMHDPTP